MLNKKFKLKEGSGSWHILGRMFSPELPSFVMTKELLSNSRIQALISSGSFLEEAKPAASVKVVEPVVEPVVTEPHEQKPEQSNWKKSKDKKSAE